MLDPRIYRTGLIAVGFGLIVLAFSLQNQQGPATTTLAPDAFNGGHAFATMTRLARDYPQRRPSSAADAQIAAAVAQTFAQNGFFVSRTSFKAQTVDGPRMLDTVTGTRPGDGFSPGSIVIVAHRDAAGSPAVADASGTAVMLELARVLSGETQHRTIVLASTSGSIGAAGAAELAGQLQRPVDAVIVLGDLASVGVRQPIVVPWSSGQDVAPPTLRNTIASTLAQQAQLPTNSASLGGQFAHLAFPITVSEQGPFGAHGLPAVLVSVSGERSPGPEEAVNLSRITGLGRTLLETISALDGGPQVPAPSAYLVYDGKVIPAWAVRVFVLALILPVLGATIDGIARARRRGHRISRWMIWVISGGLPFVLVPLLVLAVRLVGLIAIAPPGPVGAGVVPLHGGGVAILAGLTAVILVSLLALRPLVIHLARAGVRGVVPESACAGAAAGLLAVLCTVTLVIWLSNPFAAALLVPALHAWMWVVAPERRVRRGPALLLLLAGLAAPALVVVYHAVALGLSPVDAVWNGVLLIAGGDLGLLTALEWGIVAGCAVSSVLIALRAAPRPRAEEAPVTIRGPIGYAGPGSLGGTKSALRR
jgi:hypothetical protein